MKVERVSFLDRPQPHSKNIPIHSPLTETKTSHRNNRLRPESQILFLRNLLIFGIGRVMLRLTEYEGDILILHMRYRGFNVNLLRSMTT
jgi:hypothetical protein